MLLCRECGRETPGGFPRCAHCGALLEVASAEVRKTVTVVFCDLVGSTSLGERTDPELLRETMFRYHAQLRRILERHGGTVEKFVGDAAMAVFGIPIAHEDDALRAVRSAVEMRDAVAALGLEVRIGVNTGEVVAGSGETLVTGDAVNVAARLEQAAAASEILFGESTRRLVGDAVLSEPLEPIPLKGKAEPVPAYRLRELAADVPAFTRVIDAPFVGREQELLLLEQALARAAAERRPQLATVVGPPGIGKSRLVRELIQRSGAHVVVGRCLSYGEGITYWPLAEIVSQLPPLRQVVHDELAVERVNAALGEGSASSEEIAWGFRRLFESLAAERPLIVVFDDIHWAEPALLDLIEYAATFTQDAPVAMVCTARPDLYESHPGWATPRRNAVVVSLEPLQASQVETLVDELGALAPGDRARVVEAAEGNPLFVEQLLAHSAESPHPGADIPPTLQALLAARIDRLDAEARAVIERAAVEGRLFHRGAVRELMPSDSREGVGSQLITLVRKELIRPDRSQFAGDDGFRFGHILIRDAAYASLPKRIRADLHERFARWLEQQGTDRPLDEIVAYHLDQAYRYRTELGVGGDDTTALGVRAGVLLKGAGKRALLDRDDLAAASVLLRRAAELLPVDHEQRPELLVLLAASLSESGNKTEAIELTRKAQQEAGRLGQRGIELRARMNELITAIPDAAVDTEHAIAEARQAIAEVDETAEPFVVGQAWTVIAFVGHMRSDTRLVAEAAAERLRIARQHGPKRAARGAASSLISALAHGPTPVDEAIPQAEAAMHAFPHEPPGQNNLALLYAYAGRHDEAVETLAAARDYFRERGSTLWYATAAGLLGIIHLLAGTPAAAEHDVREAIELLENQGGYRASLAAILGELLYSQDRIPEAEEWARDAEQATPAEDAMAHAQWRSLHAKILARRGDAEAAKRLAAEAVEWARMTDMPAVRGDALFGHAEVHELLGRPDEAKILYQEALAIYRRKGIKPRVEQTAQALAALER